MKTNILNLITILLFIMTSPAEATLKTEKVTLKGNMIVVFNKTPKSVDNFSELFTEGMFYGRFRANFFYFDWKKEIETKSKDNVNNGIGGSLTYKTAPYYGFSATTALYTSQNANFFRMPENEVGYSKSGKDTFSRAQVSGGSGYGMTVLGQGYLEYDMSKASIKAGRQMVETVFTKSNDTKMIPNTFDALSLESRDIPKTDMKLVYIAAQKLRDHINSHDVIMYDPNDKYNSNDDSAINKSLTPDVVGRNNSLIIVSVSTKAIKNLNINASYAQVPGVLSDVTLQGFYTFSIDKWKIIPGVRYMQQMDNLGANTSVANLYTNAQGYKNPNSLDAGMLAFRLDMKKGNFFGRIGYSAIEDKADIVAPWRGFPTGDFTRAMKQYNWLSNTKTYMLRLGYDFSQMSFFKGFSVMGRYAIQDFDDAKDAVAADSTVIHVDMRQNIGESSQLKFRLGIVTADANTAKVNQGGLKTDYSYNEYRLEYNYFF